MYITTKYAIHSSIGYTSFDSKQSADVNLSNSQDAVQRHTNNRNQLVAKGVIEHLM